VPRGRPAMTAKKRTATGTEKMNAKTKAAVVSSAGGGRDTGAINAVEEQMKRFEEAIRLFRKQDFALARTAFERALDGPKGEVAHNARLHISMCDRRMQSAPVEFATAEEHYNYGIARLNTRELLVARRHFESALAMSPNGDHILYGLALCCGLGGDLQGCYENLKRAIDLQPKNRVIARQDPDFNTIAQHPVFIQLLYERP
jgi:tetratricopeptide (TPR) repeat protein